MFDGVQSALDPAGRGAVWMDELAWAAMFGGTLVLAIMLLLAICGVGLQPRAAVARRGSLRGGLMFPVLALLSVLGYVLIVGEAFSRDASHRPMHAEIVPRHSWSEIRYESHAALANELRVPVGRPIELLLPAGGRPLRVMAVSPADFDEWLARQSAPSVTPTRPDLRAGRAAFFRARCDDCHRILGTAAHGRAGPDLTHVGARLQAASAAEHVRTAARFGRSAGGSGFDTDRELQAIVEYLVSLQ